MNKIFVLLTILFISVCFSGTAAANQWLEPPFSEDHSIRDLEAFVKWLTQDPSTKVWGTKGTDPEDGFFDTTMRVALADQFNSNNGNNHFTLIGYEAGHDNQLIAKYTEGGTANLSKPDELVSIEANLNQDSVYFIDLTDGTHEGVFDIDGSENIDIYELNQDVYLGDLGYDINYRLKKKSLIAGFNDAWSGDSDFDDFIVHIDNSALQVGSSATSGSVPEPATIFMLGVGLLGLTGLRRKKLLKK